MLQTSNDFELAQTLLLDPYFLSLYVHIFKNPVIETKYDHEQLKLKVTELIPRTELFWTKSLVLTKTAGGQVLESDRKWGSLF
ncbi:MAG: hypothetical protein A2508_08800 [Candidatus Lambdaproteobacteria bacterium RIFOXYD12_FULL_49_8]|nr:MAG: hypothetical protein A2508_08800 [Candidatus Lambdaproteobacteria bacterium RIFOXYD12_FULL_49_8]